MPVEKVYLLRLFVTKTFHCIGGIIVGNKLMTDPATNRIFAKHFLAKMLFVPEETSFHTTGIII
jgi:hypothetical protein